MSKFEKIFLLILSLICAVLFGITSILAITLMAKIAYLICACMWSFNAGIRLALFDKI